VAEFGPWPSGPRTEEASVLLVRRPGGPWREPLLQHEWYVIEHLQDIPEVWDWSLGDWAEKG
jgi:hypothetical protein